MYDTLANDSTIEKVKANLAERNIEAIVVATGADALEKIKELVPAGASINNGSSTTLNQIGWIEYLKSAPHGYNNLHATAIAETDLAKQKKLRNEALFADYYLGSVHAIAESGEMIIASASGSQLPPIVHTSPNLIFVVSTQKISPTYDEAMKRVQEHVVPLEDVRMKSVGMGGTVLAKILTFEREPAFMGRKVRVILVKEKLGF
jgi:L-lactate utilization protein LutC